MECREAFGQTDVVPLSKALLDVPANAPPVEVVHHERVVLEGTFPAGFEDAPAERRVLAIPPDRFIEAA